MENVWIAFGLTLFAGAATGVGSAIAFFAKRTNYRFLSVSTGFSAGVMLYVSFVELFQQGAANLVAAYGARGGHWANAGAFFGGILLIGVIDKLVPSAENPHEVHGEEETKPLHDVTAPWPNFADASHVGPLAATGEHDHRPHYHHGKLLRMGMFTALAITIHNFPEGLTTFLVALQNPGLGVVIAVAIALHNIPEGISVSVPIFYATGDRRKAFTYSFLSGLAEPAGAAIAYVAMLCFLGGAADIPPQLVGALLSGVAGVMVYISLDELLPTSRAYGKGHDCVFGLVAGMAVMALSLLLM